MPTTSAGLFRDFLPAPQICKSFFAPLSFFLWQRVFSMLFWLPSPVSPAGEDPASRSRRWGTIPGRCIMPAQNTRKSPCRRWMIEKRNGRKIHNATCNQSCCRWISGRRLLTSPNQINTPTPRIFYVLRMLRVQRCVVRDATDERTSFPWETGR